LSDNIFSSIRLKCAISDIASTFFNVGAKAVPMWRIVANVAVGEDKKEP
jgi:hypothetical protein